MPYIKFEKCLYPKTKNLEVKPSVIKRKETIYKNKVKNNLPLFINSGLESLIYPKPDFFEQAQNNIKSKLDFNKKMREDTFKRWFELRFYLFKLDQNDRNLFLNQWNNSKGSKTPEYALDRFWLFFHSKNIKKGKYPVLENIRDFFIDNKLKIWKNEIKWDYFKQIN